MKDRQRARKIAIVGGGISGLAAAVFTRQRFPEAHILLFESEEQAGGVLSTEVHERFVLERGPLAISADDAQIRALLDALELTDALEPAEGLGDRYIYAEGALRKVSFDPRVLVREGLLSRRGAARAMMEPLIPRARTPEKAGDATNPPPSTEAVWDFFARRFGSEVAERLVQPLLLGITTGETRDTDMQTLFPTLTRVEAESGSVLGAFAMDRLRRRPRASLTQYWLRGKGLQMIAHAVTALPGLDIYTDTTIERIEAGQQDEPESKSGYTLHDQRGHSWSADEVIIATPTFVSAQLLKDLAPVAATELQRIEHYGMALVQFVYRKKDLGHLPRGLQFLVGRGQGLRMIGAQWATDVFPDQAEHEVAVLRCLYGGEFDRDASALTHADLIRTARVELATILGLETIPKEEHVMIWPRAVPHFRPGHQLRRARILAALEALPNLQVIGSGVSGLSIAACVQAGYESAQRL